MNTILQEFEKRDWSRLLTAVLGMLIFSVGINVFVVPAELYNGGVLGISQIIRTLLIRYGNLNVRGIDVAGRTV